MGASNPNTGSLPQQVPQQYAPGQAFTPNPTYQAPETSLPQLLSAIGGLGLNVAGIPTKAGAAGKDSLAYADQLGKEADSSAKENYSLQKDASKQAKDGDEARALYARIHELPESQRASFEAVIKNRDAATARQILNHNESFSRTAANQQKSQDEGYFKQTRADLNNQLGQSKYQADLATKSIDPNAAEALKEQAFFAAQQNPDKLGQQDLINKWNLTKGNKQIKDKASQTALYDRFRTQITDTAEPSSILSSISPALANTDIAKRLFGTASDQPFEGYAAKQVTSGVLQQHQQSVAAKSAADQQKQRAYDALHALNTTKDKAEAVAKAQSVMSGAQEAPASSTRQVKDAKGNLYEQDLKTGAMTPVKAGR